MSKLVTIQLYSFSFHDKHPPQDQDGGGFVFDCRGLPNPGSHEKYCDLTGEDYRVKLFMAQQPETATFFTKVSDLISDTIQMYQKKGYERLSVAFGCTGGIHRSVYMADRLSYYLEDELGMEVIVTHLNQKNWPTNKN